MKFVDSFMLHGDKVRALLDSGYEGGGKRSTITALAHKWYINPNVNDEIERRREKLRDMNVLDSSRIVKRLSKMFNGELSSTYYDKKGVARESPIKFKDQIEAGKVLVNIMGMNARRTVEPKVTETLSDELKARTLKFVGEVRQIEDAKIVEE